MARTALFLAALIALAAAAQAITGDGTTYSDAYQKNKTGKNSCGFGKLDDRWEQYYAALDSDRFDREKDCGRIIEVKGLEDGASGKWVRMMIVDECATCKYSDVDMSMPAFKDVTGFEWDRKRVEWRYVNKDRRLSRKMLAGEEEQ